MKEHHEGELIIRYIEANATQEAADELLSLEDEPVLVNGRTGRHINPKLANHMKQTIRARRKRRLSAERQYMRKKSIDLESII